MGLRLVPPHGALVASGDGGRKGEEDKKIHKELSARYTLPLQRCDIIYYFRSIGDSQGYRFDI